MGEEDNKPTDAETEATEREAEAENFRWRRDRYLREVLGFNGGNRRQVDWGRLPSMRSRLWR